MGAGLISFGLYLVFFNTILMISAAFWVFCALFLLVDWLNGSESPHSQQTPPLTTEGLDQTKAVDFVGNKETICSRCNQTSAFDTMSINEHGYFCKVCVDDICVEKGA